MDVIQQNLGYVLMGLFVAWMLWRRLIAPKLSGVQSISASEYMRLRDEKPIIVDVRTAGEWASGHAPEALHMPLNEIASRKQELNGDRPIVVMCASGNRSAVAATTLARSGFAPVYNFSGGLAAWRGAGLPIQAGI